VDPLSPPFVRKDDAYETSTKVARQDSRVLQFARFHITVSSQRPSAVVVTCHAAKLPDGATTPTEYRREDEPDWTRDLEERIQIEIHTRLARFAR
jgi:hypothetical protein